MKFGTTAQRKNFVIGVLPDPVSSYERFGIDLNDLVPLTDEVLVVMFSKNYATHAIGKCLRVESKKIFREVPLKIALYFFGPEGNPVEVPGPTELATLSVRAGRAGADGILYLTDKASQIGDFQKAVVDRVELRERLKTYGCQEVIDFFASWEKVVSESFETKRKTIDESG